MEISWTPQAVDSLFETIHFIHLHFGDKVAYRIRKLIEKRVEGLAVYPELGKIDETYSSELIKIRFIVVNRRSKVFYFVQEEIIHIVLVWDNRQDICVLNRLFL